MPKVKVLARQYKLEIMGDTDYVVVNGLNTLTFSSEKEDADTTGFDDNGRTSHIVASRGNSLTAEGFQMIDTATGEKDEGQNLIEQLADKIGYESLGEFRLTDPGGNLKEFMASANLSDQGGGVNDPSTWGAELTVSGAITVTPASEVTT